MISPQVFPSCHDLLHCSLVKVAKEWALCFMVSMVTSMDKALVMTFHMSVHSKRINHWPLIGVGNGKIAQPSLSVCVHHTVPDVGQSVLNNQMAWLFPN